MVDQTPTGATATYVLAVINSSQSTAYSVVITDVLNSGFTYLSSGGYSSGQPPTTKPAIGDSELVWEGFTLYRQETLPITFTVYISPTVGPAIYQNGFEVFASSEGPLPLIPFDACSRPATT